MAPETPNRRSILKGAAWLAAAPYLARCGQAAGPAWGANPFSLGIASGSPAPDGFVLWTRLAPDPLSADSDSPGGMRGDAVAVTYEIATDEAFHTIVRQGRALAEPQFGYSVHAEIGKLQPGRSYWYRFTSGDAVSRTGRATTAPAPESSPARLRLGFVSCSNYEHGYFSAYRHLADESPDCVIFLGDYIYEFLDTRTPGLARTHSDGADAVTLPAYRNRYAQYRLDPDLQRLHAEVPALTIWDDHEVQNDYADRLAMTFDDPVLFMERRKAAYRAYYEHMPVRRKPEQDGLSLRIHDRIAFGTLAEIALTDGRQFRSRRPCYGPPDRGRAGLETNAACPERLDPQRSMLGAEQEAWLHRGFAASKARWNVLAQGQLLSQLTQKTATGETAFWTDDWNGFPAARMRLVREIHETRLSNPILLGGDIHSYWANDVKLDFDDPLSPVVATEFVGTSISANPPVYEAIAAILPDNPHVKYFESRLRGYSMLTIEPRQTVCHFRAVSDAKDPNATISTLRAFVVEDGRAGVTPA